MTVAQLIERLIALDPDTPVGYEGEDEGERVVFEVEYIAEAAGRDYFDEGARARHGLIYVIDGPTTDY